ncbi:MbcA/ParS/Xre antitoxin family protein [Pseudoalteromonas marina]|uniref:MbcA/ParS/Xre antitoxin family protein n=1 Tax=Pseudoalteromonas marina TaxID=267375 RepID=A0ABT9FGF0_9GAMM|nr:MbcA/ParS/Xre antitoxin family protein [Pseudoalteromonas marina]MDP2565862.1 MbcA/ParS/Xre antitoxin family protein [Pseudoalteromonas marina]
MSELESTVLSQNPSKAAQVALSVFFNIMDEWKVKNQDKVILLGKPSSTTFYNWKKGQVSSLSVDTMERISYIMGIYKALGVLFPTREQADAWIKKPSSDFNGESALSYMLKGSLLNLSDVRRYLDAQRG